MWVEVEKQKKGGEEEVEEKEDEEGEEGEGKEKKAKEKRKRRERKLEGELYQNCQACNKQTKKNAVLSFQLCLDHVKFSLVPKI